MKLDEAIGKFKELNGRLHAYQHAMGMLSYDGQTGAPPKSYEGRGMSLSILSGEIYKNFINDETNELIDFLLENKDGLDDVVKRMAEEAREEYDQTSKIPMQEFMEFMKLQNEASHVWHSAKTGNDFKSFEPYLGKLVETRKRFANYRNPSIDPYNLYLDDFEKGYTMEDYDRFFDTLRDRLVPLIKDAIPRFAGTRVDFTTRKYPVDAQKKLGEYVLDVMLLDKERYSTAESEHPFTMGLNKNDVRFTTHFYETLPFSALYSTIHEAGHATYELNTADELMFTGLDDGASLGFHESQSRFYENIVGRSAEFIEFLYPKMRELFPDQLSDVSASELYMAVNKPEATLIRTEADELTYSLHVMVRYEIERMLFSGDIRVSDLPGIWNEKYRQYLGITPPDDTRGVLQDVHWSEGMFGYFPTYALGSALSSQLTAAMGKKIDYKGDIAKGDLSRINAWMTENVHRHGKLLKPKEIVRFACDEDFDAGYYCDYLLNKFSR